MITEFLLHALATLASWIAGLFPDWNMPSWSNGFNETIATVVTGIGDLGYIVPISAIGACGVGIATVWVIANSIKITRLIASYMVPGWGSYNGGNS